ncbi:MAG TPA: LysR substrate-binding domain-containing protein [Candidatus Sulfotelmatobacter sp.]|nr:LysR substrate-binding domain-containing protein [Candidatus Sulfotelmatobacter sp.]
MNQDVPELSARHLKAVVALARCNSFIAAAASLGLSQPGLSRIIQQAEARLGTALFARGTRSVAQTPAGREFVPVAERLLLELAQQAQKLRTLDGELRGQIVIASLMSISHRVLPAALVAFRQQYPKVYIQVREGLSSRVQEDVRSGIADFGIGTLIGLHHDVAVASTVTEACSVVLARGHPLARRASLRFADLGAAPMISMPTDSGLRQTIDIAAADAGASLNHSIVTNQFPSLFEFVAAGLGLAIVPACVLPADRPGIAVVPLRPAITRKLGILRQEQRPLTPPSQTFLGIFRPRFLAAVRARGSTRRGVGR